MTTWRQYLMETICFGCSRNNESPYLVLGAPIDNTVTFKPGTRFAPSRIREVACDIEFYSIFSNKDIDLIGYHDLGNVVITPGDNNSSIKRIEKVIQGVREEYPWKKIIVLGGEHTTTYGVLKGLMNSIEPNDLSYIVFDAHLDLREKYLGYRLSHASVNRLVYEEINIKPIIIGARAWSKEEYDYAKDHGIPVYNIIDLQQNMLEDVINKISKYLENTKYLYMSIDMDVVDPGYAPGVSNPEALGLTPVQLLNILYGILERLEPRQVVGFDIVEVNPLVDVNDVTSILASKIIVELTGILSSKII